MGRSDGNVSTELSVHDVIKITMEMILTENFV